MIPKKIHYCWFGKKPIPEQFQKYIDSWKTFCPDYEIVQWNEENFDIHLCEFVERAYNEEKWAFVSDYARLWIVYHEGGFYLDTDVELLKPLDELCDCSAWFACEGESINTGLGFGAEKFNEIIRRNMVVYEEFFTHRNDFSELHPCPYYTTKVLSLYGYSLPVEGVLKLDGGVIILGNSYCNPYDWASKRTRLKKHTISIHHYAGTWQTEEEKRFTLERHNHHIIKEKYGEPLAMLYSFLFWSLRRNGGDGILSTVLHRVLQK